MPAADSDTTIPRMNMCHFFSVLLAAALFILAPGCKKKPAEAVVESEPQLNAPEATELSAPDTANAPSPSGEEAAAWEALQNNAAKLTDNLPDEKDEGRRALVERLTKQRGDFQKFLGDHPQSANRWEARMAVLQIENSIAMLEDRDIDSDSQRKELHAIANDPDAPQAIRADAGLVLLQIASMQFDQQRTEQAARDLVTAINKFLESHPDDARAAALRLTEAQAIEQFDPERARTLYEEAAKNEEPEIAEAAKSALEFMALRSKPLDLTFTAVDGRKVDLAKLRGKVVLLDFWATWCPPCVEEVPNVVEAYNKFKDRGFEIIGISLDKDKSALTKFTKDNKMPWPQFFDGKGWDNEISQRFQIQSVPTMWLLDREGKLADPAPRGRLEQAIEAALSEKK